MARAGRLAVVGLLLFINYGVAEPPSHAGRNHSPGQEAKQRPNAPSASQKNKSAKKAKNNAKRKAILNAIRSKIAQIKELIDKINRDYAGPPRNLQGMPHPFGNPNDKDKKLTSAPSGENPSFKIAVLLGSNGNGKFKAADCQATMVAQCTGVTAAHCLSGAASSPGSVVTIVSEVLGTVDAHAFTHPGHDRSYGAEGGLEGVENDIAIFQLTSESCQAAKQKSFTVVPIANTKFDQNDESVAWSSRWLGGLMPGVVLADSGTHSQKTMLTTNGAEINQGDSGGGVFKNESGQLALAGVVSTRNERDGSVGGVAVNNSLSWLRNMARVLSENSYVGGSS